MFCKHDWKLLSETTTKSDYEHACEVAEKHRLQLTSIKGADESRTHIQVFTCNKCGKLKRFSERT